MTIFVISVAVALGVSFLCSLMEATLLSLTSSQVADLSVAHPATANVWRGFKTHIDRPIAVILTLNTAAHTIGASVAGAQFDGLFGDEWIWLFSILLTLVMLQYTELLPKTLGVQYNQTLAVLIARPQHVAVWLMTPVIHVLRLLNRPFVARRGEARRPAILDEIHSLAALARLSMEIGGHEQSIIQGTAKLSQKHVSEVMIPIEEVSVLSSAQSLTEADGITPAFEHGAFEIVVQQNACDTAPIAKRGLVASQEVLTLLAEVEA